MKILVCLLASLTFAWAEVKFHEGEIGGAKFVILSPEKPAGKLLLLAHGYRSEENPLSADFDRDGLFAKSLLAEGWIIASTSYRRNGWIIDDAIEDLRALKGEIAKLYGRPSYTVLLGNSMGGQIAVLAAEGALEIGGAITTGAALQGNMKTKRNPKIKFAPKVPVILLINQEANRPMSVNYHKKAGKQFCAIWKIERPGHCNVSDKEKLAAVKGLESWKAGEEVERQKNATLPIPNLPSTAKFAVIGKAERVSESWGNITTSFVADDLKALGVALKDEILVMAGTKSETLTLARHYSEIAYGKGVGYVTPEGYVQIQFFGSNLAKKLGVKTGDELILRQVH